MTAILSLPETQAMATPGVKWRSLHHGRIPSLDGLRAISISMVVGYHLLNKDIRVRTHHDYEGWLTTFLNGRVAVSIFFVISGFLITHLLMREKARTGKISLWHFYVRRTFRIWPAFFFYLSVVVGLHLMGVFGIARRELIGAATFSYNYIPHTGNPRVSAAWSLSIEEQFYLVWPLLCILVANRKILISLAVSLICIVPLVRLLQLEYLPPLNEFNQRMWEMTHTRVDTLMFGCLLALLWDTVRFQRTVYYLFKLKLHWICTGFLLTEWLIFNHFGDLKATPTIGYTLEAAAISLVVAWLVIYDNSWLGMLFNSKFLVHVGVISYSLYLWNPAFCTPMNSTWAGNFPVNLIFTILAAEISCYGIEKPFLYVRERYFK